MEHRRGVWKTQQQATSQLGTQVVSHPQPLQYFPEASKPHWNDAMLQKGLYYYNLCAL